MGKIKELLYVYIECVVWFTILVVAFLLADQGYDVWLGNARGNTYSKGHIRLPLDSAQYWNFR